MPTRIMHTDNATGNSPTFQKLPVTIQRAQDVPNILPF